MSVISMSHFFSDPKAIVEGDNQRASSSANSLTKIEEHEEDEQDQKSASNGLDKEFKCVDVIRNTTECNKSANLTGDNVTDVFDPLLYAIEFLASYNSDTQKACLPIVTSQG